MPLPPYVLELWRSMDDLLGRVTSTPWGAVVTDGRFPSIWDANYARVDMPDPSLTAETIEADLLPALARVGAEVCHVVSFHPEETTGLLTQLSSRGHRLGWDLVMAHEDAGGAGQAAHGVVVEELPPGDGLWPAVEDSMSWFGIEPKEAVAQLRRLEEEVLAPGGKRWFGVRDGDGRVVSVAALLLLSGTGYVDNVVTLPEARGRGYASAVTARIVAEAAAAGAERTILFADPEDAAVVRLYERLGFRAVGRVGSTRGPVPG